jgi:hypothetical protein
MPQVNKSSTRVSAFSASTARPTHRTLTVISAVCTDGNLLGLFTSDRVNDCHFCQYGVFRYLTSIPSSGVGFRRNFGPGQPVLALRREHPDRKFVQISKTKEMKSCREK